MLKKLLLNKLFVIGFSFVFVLLMASLIHTFVFDGEVRQVTLLYDGNGKLIGKPPIEPTFQFPFGTDRDGYDLLQKIILGAKYTILFSIFIAFLRVCLSLFLGIYYATYLTKLKKYIEGFVDAFHYIPLSLIAIYLLMPVLMETPDGFEYSFGARITIEIVILTLLVVPVTTVLIGKEITEILKKDFVEGVRTLGGNRFHILRKHVGPHLGPRLAIIFGQQVIQVLLVFAHLGLFQLFFGGTKVCYGLLCGDPRTRSITGEWSGLIAGAKDALTIHPWIPLAPVIAFALTMLAINFMLEGFKQTLNVRGPSMYKRKKKIVALEKKQVAISEESFQFKRAE